MGLRHTFHFNTEKFRFKCHNSSQEDLYRRIHKKRAMVASYQMNILFHIILFSVTGGAHLFTACWMWRLEHVTAEQKRLIEEEFERRGVALPDGEMKDKVIGAAAGLLTAELGHIVAADVIGPHMPHAATLSAGQVATEMFQNPGHFFNGDGGIHAAMHNGMTGAHEAFQSQVASLQGYAAPNLTYFPDASAHVDLASIAGPLAGAGLQLGETVAAQKIVDLAGDDYINEHIKKQMDKLPRHQH